MPQGPGAHSVTEKAEACLLSRFSPIPVANWFALRLRPNHEFRVEAFLAARGIEAFLPTWSERVKWTDREHVTVRPVFPGYILVRCERRRELYEALRLPGVLQVLPTSIEPIDIPDSQIDALRAVLDSGARVAPCAYAAGETVRIESGPLAGTQGVVQCVKGETQVLVGIEMLGRAVRVTVDASDLRRA
jgi:transcription antitermination factor NusG